MKPTMKSDVIKKRKEVLKQQLLEREKEAALQKKLYENNRNALGELMLKLIANKFADVDFDSLKRDAAGIVNQNVRDTNKRQEKTPEIDVDSVAGVENELESIGGEMNKTPSFDLQIASAY